MPFWKPCLRCDKPLVCEENLTNLKWLIGGSTIGFGVLGVFALPIAGFGAAGITGGSAAAAWQSSIGSVTAGSLFATLQSLGATGMGTIVFGSAGAALGLLGFSATRLGWCNGNHITLRNVEKISVESCQTKFLLSVDNIWNLITARSDKFKLMDITFYIEVFKHENNYLGIRLSRDKLCKKKLAVKLIGEGSVKKEAIDRTACKEDLCINDFLYWSRLSAIGTRFVQNETIHIEVEITDGNYLQATNILDCKICLKEIKYQQLSSILCGHIFCTVCIKKHIESYKKCPVCRTPAAIQDLR